MQTPAPLSRRRFLGGAAIIAAASVFSAPPRAAAAEGGPGKFCAFEKPLQFLSYDELADLLAELGFGGVEATVRPGGHVLPERVEEDLPKFVEALHKRGLEVTILTSGINRVTQPHAEKVLRTAARLGIQRYRMLWWQYDLKKPIRPQLDGLRPVLRDLVSLNRSVGIRGLYQNHAGPEMVGAGLWDIYELIREYPARDICLAYDVRHAQVEAGMSWPTQLRLVQSHLGAVCVKDFAWNGRQVNNVPLGAGRVDKKVFGLLKATGFAGPISVHVEYDETGGKEVLREDFRHDLATLRSWLAETGKEKS